jgi:signal transduction histidine kinase/ActR/RegA family two-component response regulator
VRRFRDRSIGQKLALVGMLASSVALLAASAAFVAYEVVDFRDEVVRRLTADAEIVGANTASALLFNDPEAAARTLAALGAEPHVRAAGVYDAQGRSFATYRQDGGAVVLPPLPGVDPVHMFRRGHVEVFRPIVFEGARVGTVYIESDLSEMMTRLWTFLAIMVLVCLGSFLLSVYISTRVQRVIAAPLLHLADTARTVSRDGDYSVRATPGGGDEVGTLINTFNEMLDQIRQRDAALLQAHAGLEQRVEERTADLRRSQAQLAEAQRIARLGSWERDLATGVFTWSEEMYHMYGFDPGGPLPSSEEVRARVHPEDHDMTLRQVAQAVESGTSFSFDYRVVVPGADGVRTLHADGRVVKDAQGKGVRLVGTAHDISDRIEAEEERAKLIRAQAARGEAEQASRRAAFLAEAGAALISTLDVQATLATLARLAAPELAEGCVVFTQSGEGELRPAAVEHAVPAKLEALWERLRGTDPGPEARAARDAIGSGRPWASAGGPPFLLAAPLRARDHTFGALVLVTSRGAFSRSEQDLAGALAERAALAADNARLYREAQQANRMKDEFLATLSHELRTPLNAIVGWVKLLQSGGLDADTARRAVATIDRNAKAQTQLIEDILDVSRIVAGKVNLKVAPVDLEAVAEGALDSVRHAAEAKGITLHAPGPGEPVHEVRGDPDRLQQVVWNLLSNAIKFTPRGGNVWLRLGHDDGSAEIEVRDDGLGIKPEFLPHVFERFRQSDSSSTRPHGGLGLGLAIARHLVELHGGTVEVHSEGEGKGATFRVRLPLAVGAGPAEVRALGPAAPVSAAPRLSGVSVLVVEDEADTRELVRTVLGQLGADVRLAGSAREALRAIDDQPPDVLLSDIEMPEIDGYALMRTVRERSPDRGGLVPAAALTAYARSEDRLRALRAGYQVHLAKPVEPAELAAVVASLAGRPGAV